jgi:hypothetical protein
MRLAVLTTAALLLAAAPALAKVGPISVAATPEGVWVGRSEDGLVRIDPATGRVTATSDAVAVPTSLAAGSRHVWAIDARGNRVVRIDHSGAQEAARWFRGFPSAVAPGQRSLWVLVHRGPRRGRTVLLRLSPSSLRVVGSFHLGRRSVVLAAGHGTVWLAFNRRARSGRSALVAIDERSGRLRFRRGLRGDAWGLAAGRTAVSALMAQDGRSRLVTVDARTGIRSWAARGPASPGGMAAAGGMVWVSSLCGEPRCDISQAAIRAYGAQDGQLVAGPYRTWPGCRRGARQLYLAGGIAALPGGAAVPAGDGEGSGRLAIVSARHGLIRCAVI